MAEVTRFSFRIPAELTDAFHGRDLVSMPGREIAVRWDGDTVAGRIEQVAVSDSGTVVTMVIEGAVELPDWMTAGSHVSFPASGAADGS